MTKDNATITYIVSKANKSGQNEWIKTVRGRVTEKRVSTISATWDKKGKRISRKGFTYGFRLVSYQVDGQELITL